VRESSKGPNDSARSVAGVPETDYHENRYARLLDRYVKAGARWLDLGAGDRMHGAWLGPSSRELADRAKLLIGTDLHGPHLKQNRFVTGAALSDAAALPFRSGSFDVVTANMVVEHLETPTDVLAEVARVLRPGGVFIASTPNRNNPIVFLSWVLLAADWRRRVSTAVEGRSLARVFPTHYRCNTAFAVHELGSEVGLDVRELEVFSSYPFSARLSLVVKLEALLIRGLRHPRLESFRSNILFVLERPE